MTEGNPFAAYNIVSELDDKSKALLEESQDQYNDFVNSRTRSVNLPGEPDRSLRGKAIEKIHSVLEKYPDHPNPLFLLGSIFHSMNEFPKAEAALAKIIEQGVQNFVIHQMLAEIKLMRKAFSDVEYHIDEMSKIDKTRPEIYEITAELNRLKDNHDGTLKALEKLREIAPSDERFIIALAEILAKMDKINEAIELLESEIDSFPQSYEMRFTLANLYSDAEREKDALALYKDVLDINRDHNMARFELANILDEINQPEKALELYQEYMEAIEEDPDVFYNAAGVAERLNRLDLTVDYYLTFLSMTENTEDFGEVMEWINEHAIEIIDEGELRIRLADIFVQQNDPKTALIEIESARKLGLNNRRVNFIEGMAKYDLESLDQAVELFQEAIKYDDFSDIHGFTDDDILIAHGDALLELDKLDDAEKIAQEILRGESAEDGYTLLGDIYLEKSELDLAYECFIKALKIDMFNFDGFFGLGEVFDAKGDFKNAQTAFLQSYQINEQDEDVLFRLGMDCIRLGHKEWGQFLLEKYINLYPDGEFVNDSKKL